MSNFWQPCTERSERIWVIKCPALCIIFLTCFLFSLEEIVIAQGNIRLGPVGVHPSFGIRESYDDNIFDTAKDEVADFVTIATPGIRFELPLRESSMKLGYRADIVNFNDHSSQNYAGHFIDGNIDLKSPRGAGLSVNEHFEATEASATIETDVRHPRVTNSAGISLTPPAFLFRRLGIELHYSNYNTGYTETEFESSNRNESKIGSTLSFITFPKVYSLLEINYGWTKYEKKTFDPAFEAARSDSTFYDILTGLRWDITNKSAGTFKIGYRMRDYEREEMKDFKGLVTSLGADVAIMPKTTISVTVERSQLESEFTPQSNFFENNSILFTAKRTITEKIQAIFSGGFSRAVWPEDYPGFNKPRKDDVFSGSFELKYFIRQWLFTNFSYAYQNRSSTIPIVEHKENIVSVGMALAF